MYTFINNTQLSKKVKSLHECNTITANKYTTYINFKNKQRKAFSYHKLFYCLYILQFVVQENVKTFLNIQLTKSL